MDPIFPTQRHEMFLAVTIQTAGDVLQMSTSEPAKLIESALGHAGKVEDVAIKPLGQAGTWQVSGRLRLRNGCGGSGPISAASREPAPADGDASWDLRKRARALCEGAVHGAEVACTTGVEEGILSDAYRRLRDDRRGDGRRCSGGGSDGDGEDDDYDDGGASEVFEAGRRNRRWDPLDEQRLLAWRKENMPWEWIFRQFPGRTEGAVRVRWHLLQQRSAQGAD